MKIAAPVLIIGRGGLLGRSLVSQLGRHFSGAYAWSPPVPRFAWASPDLLRAQLEGAIAAYFECLPADHADWCILWSAGTGVVGASAAVLEGETAALSVVLEAIATQLEKRKHKPSGSFFLASSAGGVYGRRSQNGFIDEDSAELPISDYGRNKLRQEKLVRAFAERCEAAHCLIGRISTLYGTGQNLLKPQGIVSHFSRALILHYPLDIFVPLDTVRDYLWVDDCAILIWRAMAEMRRISREGRAPRVLVKIFASGEPMAISQVIGIFRRLTTRPPPVLYRPSPLVGQHSLHQAYRSKIWTHLEYGARMPASLGFPLVHQRNIESYLQGTLGGSRR